MSPQRASAPTKIRFRDDAGDIQIPVPGTGAQARRQNLPHYPSGGSLVASGLINPAGARFIGKHLWITDINATSSPANANSPMASSFR
jgi:hypothetical protein